MPSGPPKDPVGKPPPYYKYAFHNIYNYTLLGGVAATALLTQNWWLGVLGGGLEALWMLFAPDSKLLRHAWFDKVHQAKLDVEGQAARNRLLAGLSEEDRVRIEALEAKREQI